MIVREANRDVQKAVPVGTTDFVSDGYLIKNSPAASVMVTSSEDLENLPSYPAGTIAYTAGFTAMWQLDATGSWVSMV